MGLLFILIAAVVWFICYKCLMLSILTTLFINIAFIASLCLVMEILSIRNPRKKLESTNKIKSKLLEKNEASSDKKATYIFELMVNEERIILSKDSIYKEIEIDEVIEVYPVYDENNKIIDFDYDFESHRKIWIPIVIFTIIFIILSIIMIINDKTGFINNLNYIKGYML